MSNMNSVQHMRDTVFFEGPDAGTRMSRFWVLLVLASVIAGAGVVGDSTATVIGAMIVAPLMTPILGVVLSTVLGERSNLLLSWAMVIAGGLTAIAVGYIIGLVDAVPVVAENNSQVAGRITPGLIDLLAALATGTVGAIALVRRDISDTLPGVAISISLVPPLSVVGLTLESGAYDQSLGALLLFVANVTAILLTGVVVLGFYRVRTRIHGADLEGARRGRRGIISIVVSVLIIGIPLTISSTQFTGETLYETELRGAIEPWAADAGWDVLAVDMSGGTAHVQLSGAPPLPSTDALIAALVAEGVDPATVTIEFIPSYRVDLGEGESSDEISLDGE